MFTDSIASASTARRGRMISTVIVFSNKIIMVNRLCAREEMTFFLGLKEERETTMTMTIDHCGGDNSHLCSAFH